MNQMRRNLLLGAGGALGGAALAAPGALAASRDRVELLTTYVTGTAYHEAGEAASALRPGDLVELRREPSNDYDPRSIAVRTPSGAKLGDLPRAGSEALASLMDAGFAAMARIREVLPDARQPEIRLAVLLTV
jgi:HIRAN domain